MSQDADYILFQPAAPAVNSATRAGEIGATQPASLTEGLWQEETLAVLQMYSDKAQFSPVN